jgi:actin-like ATPase involved in cell morphogenesis
VVVGLPISQYLNEKVREAFRDTVMGFKTTKVTYNGTPRVITIEDVIVRPQGVLGPNNLTVDIGSRTTDISWVQKGELLHGRSLYQGLFNLYESIIDKVNTTLSLSLPDSYAETVLKQGVLMVHDQEVDIDFVEDVINDFLNPIIDELNLTGSADKVGLCGGGAEVLYERFNEKWPCFIAPEPVFANVHVFKAYGDRRWKVIADEA